MVTTKDKDRNDTFDNSQIVQISMMRACERMRKRRGAAEESYLLL